MTSYRWHDGKLERVEWPELERVRTPVFDEPPILFARLHYTRAERRRIARVGTRGRRGARRVARMKHPPTMATMRVEVWERHRLYNGIGLEVWLYLPEGQKPTKEQCREVKWEVYRERYG